MKIRIAPQQVQKPILAPSMQQSIEMLILPLTELSLAVEQELQNNPLLEALEDKETADQQFLDRYINQSLNSNQIDITRLADYDLEGDEEREERPLSQPTTLEESLKQQLNMELNDPERIKIGEYIIGLLDEDGFLSTSCEDIAQLLGIDITLIEEVLMKVQSFEPIGIASRNLKECLVIQAQYLFNGKSPILITLINDHLENIARKRYYEISKDLKIPPDDIKKLSKLIARLDPRPARQYRPITPNIYIKPDITVIKNQDDQFQAHINKDTIPRLRISPVYQKMLKQPNRTDEEIQFIRDKIKSGLFFIKSIEQRHQTIKQIAEYIIQTQIDFFEQGTMAIKPMILRDVAVAINRNESTISRAINNKYIETPHGLFPMKFFFSQAIRQNENGTVSSRSIKEDIKQLVDEEDKTHPLSDQDIQDHFQGQGISLARRTVSKYRQMLHIMPSNLRKN